MVNQKNEALVIIPATNGLVAEQAVRSVLEQTVPCDVLVVCDGPEFADSVKILEKTFENPDLQICVLPFNTGGNGFYGHRIMAGFSHLVNHKYLLFLDQDNWFEPNHVGSLVSLIKTYKHDWAHSLRKIHSEQGEYICDDNCESLGKWNAWVDPNVHLVDTSSYCFKTEWFRLFGHIWHAGWGADRRFYEIIRSHVKHTNYGCTGEYTLSYRLGGNEGSVTKEFFEQGNQAMLNRYPGGKFPWKKENQFITIEL